MDPSPPRRRLPPISKASVDRPSPRDGASATTAGDPADTAASKNMPVSSTDSVPLTVASSIPSALPSSPRTAVTPLAPAPLLPGDAADATGVSEDVSPGPHAWPLTFCARNDAGDRMCACAPPTCRCGGVASPLSDDTLTVLRDVWSDSVVRVFTCTWNMNAKAASTAALREDLFAASSRFHLCAIGTQECERSIAQSVLISSSKEKWEAQIAAALGSNFTRVATATLSATHLAVYAHTALRPAINDVQTAFVPCGVGDVLGNKGGVAVGFNVGKTAFLFMSAHLAAHQRGVSHRNRDFWRIERRMPLVPAGFGLEAQMTARQEAERLSRLGGAAASATSPSSSVGATSPSRPRAASRAPTVPSIPEKTGQRERSNSRVTGDVPAASPTGSTDDSEDEDDEDPTSGGASHQRSSSRAAGGAPDGRRATARSGSVIGADTSALVSIFDGSAVPSRVSDRYDRVFFMGDFNYRINLSREAADEALQALDWDKLWQHDQLRIEYAAGRSFEGYAEGPVYFMPTYKYDKGSSSYDSSEKKRVPAWCDRVLFKSLEADIQLLAYYSVDSIRSSDHRAVVATFQVPLRGSHQRRGSSIPISQTGPSPKLAVPTSTVTGGLGLGMMLATPSTRDAAAPGRARRRSGSDSRPAGVSPPRVREQRSLTIDSAHTPAIAAFGSRRELETPPSSPGLSAARTISHASTRTAPAPGIIPSAAGAAASSRRSPPAAAVLGDGALHRTAGRPAPLVRGGSWRCVPSARVVPLNAPAVTDTPGTETAAGRRAAPPRVAKSASCSIM